MARLGLFVLLRWVFPWFRRLALHFKAVFAGLALVSRPCSVLRGFCGCVASGRAVVKVQASHLYTEVAGVVAS